MKNKDKQFKHEFKSLNQGQQLVYLGVQKGQNMLITGGGGVGKSHLIRFLAQYTDNLVLTASTGIAAINIEGQTINSFMGFSSTTNSTDAARIMDETTYKRLSIATSILIDEVSMIRADLLDMIDARLQAAKDNNLPFGGVQIIIVGDFCQLPPVVTHTSQDIAFKARYKDRLFSFEADCYDTAGFVPYVLTEYVRQGDEMTRKHFRNLRMGHKVGEALEFINSSAKGLVHEDSLRICKTNKKATHINTTRFETLSGPTVNAQGVIEGVFPKSSCPVGMTVQLKKGCRVLLSANHVDGDYFNGDLGFIISFCDGLVAVKLDRGPIVNVEPHEWKNYGHENKNGEMSKEPVGTFSQFPIKLGYAITAHKSQGMTLESAIVDLGGNFNECGLTYVVISRVKSLDNLKLTNPIRYRDIQTSSKAVQFTFKVSTEAMKRQAEEAMKLAA